MIITDSFDKDIYGEEVSGTNTSYYGDSISQIPYELARNVMRERLGKEGIANGKHRGVIIGFEDNNQCYDYYYIVYVPELNTVVYQLFNDAEFSKTIE